MREFFDKYWSWLFVLIVGPVLEYLTYKYHLQTAPISPVLPFFVLVLFLPPWEAATGFLIAVSYSTIAMITGPHPNTHTVVIRVLLLLFFAILILVVKKRLDRKNLLLKIAKAREAELEATLKVASLEESLRMRDQFLSIAAHELKTPIGSIILYADLLEANFYKSLNTKSQYIDFFEDQKAIIEKSISVIQRQATTISRLINQFLDISVINHGKINLVKERFDLSTLLREVCELSQIQTNEHKINLTYNKEIYINADRIRMEQIMVNLLNNAIKYSPNNGSIEVKAIQIGDVPIQITVRDHGVGIREEDRDKIFTKFYRARPDLSPNGLGLGLYLSREIVLQHNGVITFENPEYGGTIFTIILPSSA